MHNPSNPTVYHLGFLYVAGDEMIHYQIYKRHHEGRFVGWEIGYEKFKEKKGRLVITSLISVALFYGKSAKKNAYDFVYILDGK